MLSFLNIAECGEEYDVDCFYVLCLGTISTVVGGYYLNADDSLSF